jgi:hypothetical protein
MLKRYRTLQNGNVGHVQLFLLCILFMSALSAADLSAATVFTDRPDYPPGDVVQITGTDFWSNETVSVQVTHLDGMTPPTPEYDPWDVIANSFGNFDTYWDVPEDALGETLLVTAEGQSSGLIATTTFTDNNTRMILLSDIPDTLCPGSSIEVCITLYEHCPGGSWAELPNRPILFFVNEGNCGVNVGQDADDTVYTDANGVACATLTFPDTTGDYSVRAKFLGEAKPSQLEPPNSVCDPDRRIRLSAANKCEVTYLDPSACNEPPVCYLPPDDTVFVCGDTTFNYTVSATDPDNNLDSCYMVSGVGSYYYGTTTWTFTTSGPGDYCATFECIDSFEATCGGTVCITVVYNLPPVASCPAPVDTFVCDLSPMTIGGFGCTDPDNNLTSCVAISGTYSGGSVTFTPVVGVNTIKLVATDACGEADTCETTVTVTLNSPPVASCPAPVDTFVCDLSPMTIGGFGCTDPDNNLTSCVAIGGTYSGGSVTFTPIVGINTIKLIATDACGEADTCETTVTVTLNSPPVASCPAPVDTFVCDLSPMTIGGFACTDPDNNLTSCIAIGGTYSGGSVTFTPVVGINTIKLIATDVCGEADTCETTVTVTLNQAPTCEVPANTAYYVCDLDTTICLDGFNCDDPDNNYSHSTINGAPFGGGSYCFAPNEGDNIFTLICYDSCGDSAVCQTTIHVDTNQPPTCEAPANATYFVCDLDTTICLDGFSCDDPDNNYSHSTINGAPFGGGSYCFAPMEGDNVLTLICYDSCGDSAVCQTTIHVDVNSPPDPPTCPPWDTVYVCYLDTICIDDGFGCSDPDNNLMYTMINGVPYGGGPYCFIPVEGDNILTLTCIDSCYDSSSCQTLIRVEIIPLPVADCPAWDTVFVCDLDTTICIDDFDCQNADGSTINGIPFGGGSYCFTPLAGNNIFTLICANVCGADTCQTVIYVDTNRAPLCDAPGDTTFFVCDLDSICIPDGFDCYDPDNNLMSTTINGVPYSGGPYCFLPAEGDNILTLICVDSCYEADTCETVVHVDTNRTPEPDCPPGDTFFVCILDTTICVEGFSCYDPDDNLLSSTINGMPYGGGLYCFQPVEGDNILTLTCIDSCYDSASCQTIIHVDLNEPPTCDITLDQDIFTMTELDTICVESFSCYDPDNNYSHSTINGDPYYGGPYCFMPVEGINILTLICVDSCGLTATCIDTVIVELEVSCECPSFKIEKKHRVYQGHYTTISITHENNILEMGGFDFLIAYDASALTFTEATPGQLLEDCDWEYFTYRYGIHGNCGDACPSGLLRIVAIADIDDGPHHPSCYGAPDCDPHQIAELTFYVTNDRTFQCQFVPIYFFWDDCGDNSVSNIAGDTLFIDSIIYDFEENIIWDESDDDQFPEDARIPFVGAPDYCLNDDPEKPSPVRIICFINGGVDIICDYEYDDRGDINLNGVTYEVADATVFTNYFIFGLAAFVIDVEGQIMATDVNADGRVLTVGDLVYLIRVIVGDALPLEKEKPLETVNITSVGEAIYVDTELGAMAFTLEGKAEVTLGDNAAHMELITNFDGVNTKALVYSFTKGRSFTGEVVITSSRLLAAEAADYNGNVVEVNMLPTSFSVRNYPNPFNPTSVIEMTLPMASTWNITIYNVIGQRIAQFEGYSEAGAVTVTWDASRHASGIYFYKATAGQFNETRKMVLLK